MKPRTALLFSALAALLLSACETPAPVKESAGDSADSGGYEWRSTEKGVSLYAKLYDSDTKLEWEGGVNEQNRAHGFGKLRRYPAPAPGTQAPAFVDTQTGFMVDGRFEGVITGSSTRGGGYNTYDKYSQGKWETSLGNDSPRLTSASMPAPALGTNTGTATTSLQASSGTITAAPASAPVAASSSSVAASPAPAAITPPRQTLKGNLIDQWGLRRAMRSGGDHMKFYLMAADKAYESYQQSGSDAFYEQHEQYAELARTFHERTGDETTGFSR